MNPNNTDHSKRLFYVLLFLVFTSGSIYAQENENVYVDEKGVMRWEGRDEQVKGFGVNYSVPFAHAFRSGQKMGVDLKQAIRDDVYHFSRLGFDLYRIHVWDTEISDEEGNLIENEHLDLFDFLINELKSRGVNFVLTPIAYWGNGWPEPDEDTPGFSDKYGKEKSLTDPEAIAAQENYLAEFLNHVNPYTGIAYKDEPHMVAFEISNEPHHRESPEDVKKFINKMVASMRSTGVEKPIFYNVSHSIHLAEVYASTNIDGGTFQWYPTGLGFGKELEGNLLPNVDHYKIPFNEAWRQKGLAKLVYEFDAADVMKSHIYPAMARSFRQAGIQVGTHFAYDPTFLAAYNTEYDTHYMNLAFTPSKALALMISGEVFRNVPLYSELGKYPENRTFGSFRIDPEKDLALMNSGEKFIYTRSTHRKPKNLKSLKQIAGYGSSPIVQYPGRGAYFLDKLEDGVWRLELMPDAIAVHDPFGDNNLEKTLTLINYAAWEMKLDLPDLGSEFFVEGVNKGNEMKKRALSKTVVVKPGTYILTRKGKTRETSYPAWNKDLKSFVAPESNIDQTYLVHDPLATLTEKRPYELSATVIANEEIEQVQAWLRNGNTYENVTLQNIAPYTFSAPVPENLLENGILEYRIIVSTAKGDKTFPEGIDGNPGQWDFIRGKPFSTRIVNSQTPVYLFNAAEDSESIAGKWLPSINSVPTEIPGVNEYQVNVEALFEVDPENRNATPVYDYSFRYTFKKKVEGRRAALENKNVLVLKGQALNQKPVKLQVALVMNNGKSFGKVIEVQPGTQEYRIDLSELQPVKTVTLPRPYPTFLPLYFDHNIKEPFKIENAESLQFSIGPGLSGEEAQQQHGVGIISVRLE